MFIFELGNSFWLKSLPDKNVKARSDFHNKICCSVLCFALGNEILRWYVLDVLKYISQPSQLPSTLQQITVIICVSSFIQMLSAT
jgi:hypothetical protein